MKEATKILNDFSQLGELFFGTEQYDQELEEALSGSILTEKVIPEIDENLRRIINGSYNQIRDKYLSKKKTDQLNALALSPEDVLQDSFLKMFERGDFEFSSDRTTLAYVNSWIFHTDQAEKTKSNRSKKKVKKVELDEVSI